MSQLDNWRRHAATLFRCCLLLVALFGGTARAAIINAADCECLRSICERDCECLPVPSVSVAVSISTPSMRLMRPSAVHTLFCSSAHRACVITAPFPAQGLQSPDLLLSLLKAWAAERGCIPSPRVVASGTTACCPGQQ
jgi:hypothetical protein